MVLDIVGHWLVSSGCRVECEREVSFHVFLCPLDARRGMDLVGCRYEATVVVACLR